MPHLLSRYLISPTLHRESISPMCEDDNCSHLDISRHISKLCHKDCRVLSRGSVSLVAVRQLFIGIVYKQSKLKSYRSFSESEGKTRWRGSEGKALPLFEVLLNPLLIYFSIVGEISRSGLLLEEVSPQPNSLYDTTRIMDNTILYNNLNYYGRSANSNSTLS